jgi:tetratricopeptide (TPR) repeat protein
LVVAEAVNQSYSRAQVQRLLNVSKRQLDRWKKHSFVRGEENYSFQDIIAIRALLKLRAKRAPPAKVEKAVASLRRKLAGIESPLSELSLHWNGKSISVRIGGNDMEAVSGQFLLNFDAREGSALREFAVRPKAGGGNESEHWFQEGLTLEETGAPMAEAIAAYEKAIDLNPNAAGALVNLGTIYFRDRKWKKAEAFYQRAVEADPRYPLAHFNLANLHDEQGRTELARKHYLEAVRLDPKYADAYYNLALLSEQEGETMAAMGFWKSYLRLDGGSSWAEVARRQMDRLKQSTFVVSR